MFTAFNALNLLVVVVEPFTIYVSLINSLARGKPNQPQPIILICLFNSNFLFNNYSVI